MEEVNNDDRDGKLTALVFPGDFKQFFLRLVPQFALPKSYPVVGHHGHGPCYRGIGLFYLSRRVTGRDPIVQLLG